MHLNCSSADGRVLDTLDTLSCRVHAKFTMKRPGMFSSGGNAQAVPEAVTTMSKMGHSEPRKV
jgi:hypothetical protein